MRSLKLVVASFIMLLSWMPAVYSARKSLQFSLLPESGNTAAMIVNGQPVFSFEAPVSLRREPSPTSAFLNLQLARRHRESGSICVFEVKSHYSIPGSNATELVLLRTARVDRDQQSVAVDLTDRVAQWLRKGKRLRLVLDCIGCNQFAIEAATGPTIDIRVDKSSKASYRRRRQRFRAVPRSEPTCINGQGCCIKKLYIDFRKLGWDSWIISPTGYNANYCKGNCSNVPRTPDTFNTHYSYILDRYRRKAHLEDPACCVPTRLRPMSLLYYDNKGQIVKSDVPNMIVDECGCV